MMRKIKLDLGGKNSRHEIQNYLMQEMHFPDYYGKNLDALYDCLTEITEDTCIALIRPEEESEISHYLQSIARVFSDAEKDNPHLCLFVFP